MKLATVEAVRTALGVASITAINNAISQALDKATEMVATDIRVPSFAKGSFADVFYVHKRMPNSAYEFLLASGFLDSDFENEVTYSSVYRDIEDDPFSTLVAGEDYFVDHEKGVVHVREYRLHRFYVRVTYLAGFEVDDSDATLYDQTQVPEWLRLAAVSKAQELVRDSPVLNFEGTQKPEMDALRADYTRLVTPHIRYKPLAFLPFKTSAVA